MKLTIAIKQLDTGKYWASVLGLPSCGVYLGDTMTEIEDRIRTGVEAWAAERASRYDSSLHTMDIEV